ncbi:MAG: hypothetical protein IKS32_12945 [Solobacterium sp.]|nr:hypothetical protein [Solobacterium sp.]
MNDSFFYQKKVSHAVLAAALSLSALTGNAAVIAEESGETPDGEIAEETLPEESAEESEEPEEETESELQEVASEEGTQILEIRSPEMTDLIRSEKPALEELLSSLPQTLEVLAETGWTRVNVTWNCLQDYEAEADQYVFAPVFEGYTVNEAVKIPHIILFIGEVIEGLDESAVTDEEFEIESPEDNGLLYAAPGVSYDNRPNLPVVRNQNYDKLGWSYAAIGAMEADLIHDKKAEKTIDYSELQLAYFSSHDYTDPKGNHAGDKIEYSGAQTYLSNIGNGKRAYRMLANMVGPVYESELPLEKGPGFRPDDKYAVSSNAAQLTGAYLISPKAADRNYVKQMIMDHGAVTASLLIKPNNYKSATKEYKVRYNALTNAFYGEAPTADAAKFTVEDIMLVGWDDTFSKEKFTEGCQPEEDGAWLVRNSRGLEGEGLNGYFWLSYLDASLAKNSYFTAYDASADLYSYVYSYDKVPVPTGTYTYSDKGSVTVSQTFNVTEGETIQAIGVETGSVNLKVTATVTDGTNTAAAAQQTIFQGFYSLPLDKPFKASGKPVTLTVTYEKTGNIKVLTEMKKTEALGSISYTGALSGPGADVKAGESTAHLESDLRMRIYTTVGDKPTPAPTPSPTPAPTPEPTPEPGKMFLYRLYNPNSGEHFYTKSIEERKNLVSKGWNYEGIGFTVKTKTDIPVYRMYNPNAGDHHYTMKEAEKENLIKLGWNYEGIGWYASDKTDENAVPTYRLYNKNATGAGSHHYTVYETERDQLVKVGWSYEGIGFYTCKRVG